MNRTYICFKKQWGLNSELDSIHFLNLGKNDILHIIDQRKFEKGYINYFQICSQAFKKKVIKRSNSTRRKNKNKKTGIEIKYS